MFDFFKTRPADVKGIRSAILQFLKEQLQKTEGGEGSSIKGLEVYVTCRSEEKHLYEAAMYLHHENGFKSDIQKIADDYAIALPPNWTLDIAFTDTAPAEATKAANVDVALSVGNRKKPGIVSNGSAVIKVLNGEAEKTEYTITSQTGKINIGREPKTATADGFQRQNHIAFVGSSPHESNRSVSRQHAHIEWDAEAGAFFIFADEGGIPPYNKTKVKAKDGLPVKLQTTQIGHRLQNGDQLIIGESAILEFWGK